MLKTRIWSIASTLQISSISDMESISWWKTFINYLRINARPAWLRMRIRPRFAPWDSIVCSNRMKGNGAMTFDTGMEIQNRILATITEAITTKVSRMAKESWVMMDARLAKGSGLMDIFPTKKYKNKGKLILEIGSLRWNRCWCSPYWWWIFLLISLIKMSKSLTYLKNAQHFL